MNKTARKLWDPDLLVQVTSFGAAFVAVTSVVAVGATNTANNGLYILLSLFLAILVVSGILSRRNVAGLVPSLTGPEELFALEPARFVLTLRNDGRERVGILVRLEGREAPYLFPAIARASAESRGIELVFPRRGAARIGALTVYSGYPIGLFRKGRRHPWDSELVVFPRPDFLPLPEPEASRLSDEGARSDRRGRGAGIRNLREALPGDDPRDIHWPQTARQGTPIVRERDAEETRSAIVVLESAPGSYETAVSEAAGAVLQLLARGDRVGLAAGEAVLVPGTGPHHRRALLGALATARPTQRAPSVLPADATVYRIRPRAGREAGR